MKTLFAVFALALLCSSVYSAHQCSHGAHDYEPVILQKTAFDDEIEAVGFAEESVKTPQPLRIKPVYVDLQLLTAGQKNLLQNILVPQALERLSQLLSIERERDTISFYEEKCYTTPVPRELIGRQLNTDLVMLIVAEEMGENTLAAALACGLHYRTNRPILGAIYFNTLALNTDPSTWNNQLHTALHEMIHILGISPYLFSKFRAPQPVVRDAVRRGVRTKILTTPKVVELAKVYFNCSRIDGIELENEGGPGSLASHLERRIFGDETMTASDIPDPKLSIFTLAVLEDSGWYKPNYAEAQQLYFGKGRGCDFLEQSCIDKRTRMPRFPEFCSNDAQPFCTSDRTAVGMCGIDRRQNLPFAFNYFGDDRAGWDVYADGCPTVFEYSGASCKSEKSKMFGKSGGDSRCFSVIEDSYALVNHMCLEHKCNYDAYGSAQLSIVHEGKEYACPNAGGTFSFARGYRKFMVDCPPAEEMCFDNFHVHSIYNENTGTYEFVAKTLHAYYEYVKGWWY